MMELDVLLFMSISAHTHTHQYEATNSWNDLGHDNFLGINLEIVIVHNLRDLIHSCHDKSRDSSYCTTRTEF